MTLYKKPFERIMGKRENAGDQHFSFSYNVFYSSRDNFQIMSLVYFVICIGEILSYMQYLHSQYKFLFFKIICQHTILTPRKFNHKILLKREKLLVQLENNLKMTECKVALTQIPNNRILD